jgi:hypothetical protein
MGHLKLFEEFVNLRRSAWDISESTDPQSRFEIIDAIKNTDAGKLLQRILKVKPEGSGTYLDFDKVFTPVKTGRVYIGAGYGGKTRIYKNYGTWWQESEASGNIYNSGKSDTLEGIIKYCVIRYVETSLERGIDKKDIVEWMKNNWSLLYTLSSVQEILAEYKMSKGMDTMIMDASVIPTLSNYKNFKDLLKFNPEIYPNNIRLHFDIDPFNLGFDKKRYTHFVINFKLTNKNKYSATKGNYGDFVITIGASSMEDLNDKFLKGLKYGVNKYYDAIDPNGDNPDSQVSRKIVMSLLGDKKNDPDFTYNYFIKLHSEEPMIFSKAFNILKTVDPVVSDLISKEIGEKDIDDLRKGSSLLGKFGIE